jgi:undecaprenyl-diphosphatase
MHAVRFALRRGIPLFMVGSERLRTWASTRETWPSRTLCSLLDPSRHEARALAALAILFIGAAWLFLCDSAWKKDPLGGVIGVQKGPLC